MQKLSTHKLFLLNLFYCKEEGSTYLRRCTVVYSVGRGWKNCSMDMFPHMTKRKKRACLPQWVLFLIWPREPLYYQFSFFQLFLDFWSWFEGVICASKMFKNTFLLKIYPKASKKPLKFTLICSYNHGGFVTPSDHCALQLRLPAWFFMCLMYMTCFDLQYSKENRSEKVRKIW